LNLKTLNKIQDVDNDEFYLCAKSQRKILYNPGCVKMTILNLGYSLLSIIRGTETLALTDIIMDRRQ
jgi:hypothetical protein